MTAGTGATGVKVEIVPCVGFTLIPLGIPGIETGTGSGTGPTGATFGKLGGGIGTNAVLIAGGARTGVGCLNVDFATVIIDGTAVVGCLTVFEVSVKSGMALRSISSKNPDSFSPSPSVSWPSSLPV